MKTSLENINAVKQKLSIVIDAEEVDKKFNNAYRQIGKKAKIPGFRPGKAPRKILERQFGEQVAEDVSRDLINETFPQAIEKVDGQPLGMPMLEKELIKQGKNFVYSAIFEIRPHFEINDYLNIEIEKEKCKVTAKNVDNQLYEIRKAHGKASPVEDDRPIKNGDMVTLDYTGFHDQSPLEEIHSTDFVVNVGSNRFHSKFEKALIGCKVGEKPEITIDFEDGYVDSRLSGKTVTFKVTINDLKELTLPDLNDEFAKSLGSQYRDLKTLKKEIKASITTQEEKRTDREAKQRLMDHLSETVQFELPPRLVESELQYHIESVKQNLSRTGADLEKMGLTEDKLKADFKPVSEKRVKEILILSKIAELEKISVSEADVTEGYKELALSTGQDPESLKKYYEAKNLTDSLREKLLQEKTLNYLFEHANILEVGKVSQAESKNKKGVKG